MNTTREQLLAAAALDFRVTAEPGDRVGVHVTHCCWKHGCKYGDAACPVKLNLAEQEYPCEHCGETIAMRPLRTDATPDQLLHRLRELTIAYAHHDPSGYADAGEIAEDFARTFDQLDRHLSTHGSAFPGAWASPEGETP